MRTLRPLRGAAGGLERMKALMIGSTARTARLALAVTAALTLAACARSNPDEAGLGGAGLGAGAAAPGSAQDFARSAGDRVFFESDSSELTGAAQATLDKQAAWLSRYANVPFVIEGHADERGTREYNIALGDRRANAVKETLVSYGIDRNRITTISYGKDQPICGEASESCYAQNRRATTTIVASGY